LRDRPQCQNNMRSRSPVSRTLFLTVALMLLAGTAAGVVFAASAAGSSGLMGQVSPEPKALAPDHSSTGTPISQASSDAAGCLNCHQDVKQKLESISRHAPAASGSCAACHGSFHTGASQAHNADEEVALCVSCHPQSTVGYSHPVGARFVDPITKGPLTCTSTCHDPHGSQNRFLGRIADGARLCLACHPVPGSIRP